MIDFIGYLAGFVAMISFLPQIHRTFTLKSADDVSLSMLYLTLITNGLYLIYGVALALMPVVVMIGIMTVIVLVEIAHKSTIIQQLATDCILCIRR